MTRFMISFFFMAAFSLGTFSNLKANVLLTPHIDSSCYERLLFANADKLASLGSGDSRAFRLMRDEMNLSENLLPEQEALQVIAFILEKEGCQVTWEEGKTHCSKGGVSHEDICEVDVGPGYFVIFSDYVDHIFAIFNRWD